MLTKVDMVLATMSSRSMQAGLELLDGLLAQLDVADEVPRTGRDEPGRDDAPRVARLEHVAGDLLADESAVRHILIQGSDHIIAIGPGMIPALVLVVAVGIAVVDDVEPVPAPSLAVSGRGEQPIDQLLVGIRGVVAEEPVDLLGRRRQAVQVEGEAADQGPAIGLGAVMQPLGLQPAEDERVDRRADPGPLTHRGQRRPGQGLGMPTTPARRIAGRADARPSGHWAPCSIHSRRLSTCSLERGLSF